MALMNSRFWGHVELVREYRDPIMLEGLDGKLYDSGEEGPRMLEFKCECGHVWSIRKDMFPGRRRLKSCGRRECTAQLKTNTKQIPVKSEGTVVQMDGDRVFIPGLNVSVKVQRQNVAASIPFRMSALVEHYAQQRGISKTKAAGELLEIGLKAYFGEDLIKDAYVRSSGNDKVNRMLDADEAY